MSEERTYLSSFIKLVYYQKVTLKEEDQNPCETDMYLFL